MKSGLRSSLSITAAAAVGALVLTACGSGSGSGAGSDGKVQVVASFYPMAYLAERIGGGNVEVENLTSAGVEPHDLELSPQQVGDIAEADLAVYLKGMQPAVDEAIDQNRPEHVVEATEYSPLEQHGSEVDGTEGHGKDGEHAHEDGGHDEEGHAEGDGHDHSEAGGDPHIWLDPTRYAKVAEGVGEQLAEADPGNKAEYRANTEKLTAELGKLDGEFTAGLKDDDSCRTKAFVTSHAAFGYLAERYALDEIAISGVDPDAEPSPAELKQVQAEVKEHDIDTVFFETLASPKTAETLASDLDLKTAVLDPIEGVKDPEKQSYFTEMRANLSALQTSMGCS